MSRITNTLSALLIGFAGVATSSALASEAAQYPTRQMSIIVGFAAGGAPDALARIIGEKLNVSWGQPVIVENRSGAQGNIAITAVANADPDGHTLALVASGNAVIYPSLFKKLSTNPGKDLAPITQIASFDNVLVTSSTSPIKNMRDLIDLGRSKTKDITYATPGAGSVAHLAAEMLARSSGFEMRHVPYRGVTPALTDVVRGEVTVTFAQLSTAKPFIDGGQLRALAVASKERISVLPDVPTVAEAAGIPGFEAVSWYALMAPLKTPEPIIEKLHKEVARLLHTPDVKAAMQQQGAEPIGNTPAELSAVIDKDSAKWSRIIEEAGIRVD